MGRLCDSMSGSCKTVGPKQCHDGGCMLVGRLCDSMSESWKNVV